MMKLRTRAMRINELRISLENIAHDDGRKVEDFSDQEILEEAKYVLGTFNESGHANNDCLNSDDGDLFREYYRQYVDLKKLVG